MSAQLALRLDYRSLWDELRRLLREVVDQVGVKQVAYDLDLSPSQLLHALDERERHHVHAEWLPYLIVKAADDRIVEFVCALRGLEPTESKPLAADEELANLKEEVSKNFGPAIASALLTAAKRRRRS